MKLCVLPSSTKTVIEDPYMYPLKHKIAEEWPQPRHGMKLWIELAIPSLGVPQVTIPPWWYRLILDLGGMNHLQVEGFEADLDTYD